MARLCKWTDSSKSVSDIATAQIVHAWEDVKAMFNGGTRKRLLAATTAPSNHVGRHSSHGTGGGASGKGSSSNNRSQSHGENHNCNGGNTGHPRNNGSSHHPTKKESGSATTSSSASSQQHPPGYNHQDAPHASNFLHQSQNLFLNSPNPLLSPSGRLESIWNPALSGPGAAGQGSRPCSIPGSPQFPALPFHPLSIPWLRRPLFPFSHPFGPTLLNDPGCAAPDKLVNLAVARQNQSAFKPVSRSVEPLFNWLNGNNLAGGAGAINLGHSGATAVTLPEDLSVNSCGHAAAATTPAVPSGTTPTIPSNNPHFNVNTVGGGSFNLAKHLESSGEKTNRHHNNNNNNNNGSSTPKNHQIQILNQNESDDEENVDIESTVETEECSSTSSVWVSSTTAYSTGGRGSSATPRLTSPYNLGHNNNINNNNNNIVEFRRRKRLAPCYSSGEDMDEHDSDNQDDSTNDHYDDTPEERERNGNKRKRFWISKITDDEDDKIELSKGTSKPENSKLHGSSSSGRVLLEFTRD
ncbi:hypothetical protein Ocin01_01676 [Orchesella cincta]|uniref:Uncharacterized protein n=1 Tax=Orchesella cincta TaxID=48709 RepID=A0A1D2NID1_ORCCI|nr:hypothetical protein Ocin01_01676 [Orchesella cincta]